MKVYHSDPWATPLSILAIVFVSLCLTALFSCSSGKSTASAPSQPLTVTDIDGNVYQTVKIGDQWWMTENLQVTHYRSGDPIPQVTESVPWSGLTSGGYCYYGNDVANEEAYGHLYNWFAVNDDRGLAPVGWHVPTDDEWQQLEIYLGMGQDTAAYAAVWRGTDEGGKLKDTGTAHWDQPNTGATNATGFSALAGGYRVTDGSFTKLRRDATFWTSSENNSDSAWFRDLSYSLSQIYRDDYNKRHGFSVRCVRD